MPTVANLPGADVRVQFPSGEVKNVFMIRMLVQTQNAEMKAKHGVFLPAVAKLNPTVQELREFYELDWFASEQYPTGVRTWEQCAVVMRWLYNDFQQKMAEARG